MIARIQVANDDTLVNTEYLSTIHDPVIGDKGAADTIPWINHSLPMKT